MKLGFGNINSSSGDTGSTNLIFTCDKNPGFEDRTVYAKVYFADDPTKYTTLTIIQRAVDGTTIMSDSTNISLYESYDMEGLVNTGFPRGDGTIGFRIHIVDTSKGVDEYKDIVAQFPYSTEFNPSGGGLYTDILWSFDGFKVTDNSVLTIEDIVFGFYSSDAKPMFKWLKFWNINISNGNPDNTGIMLLWDLTELRPNGTAYSIEFNDISTKIQDGSDELVVTSPIKSPITVEAFEPGSVGMRSIGVQGGYSIHLTPRDDIQRNLLAVTGNPEIVLNNTENIPISCDMELKFDFINQYDNRVRNFSVKYPVSIVNGELSYNSSNTYYTDTAVADDIDFSKNDITLSITEVSSGSPNYEIDIDNRAVQKISTGDIECRYNMFITDPMNIVAGEKRYLTNTSVSVPDLNTAEALKSFIIDYELTLSIQERTEGDMYVAFRPGTSTEVSLVTAAGYDMTIPQLYVGFRFVIAEEDVNAGFNFNIEHASPASTHVEYTSSSSTYSLDSYPDTTPVEMTGIVLAVGTTSTGLSGKKFQVANGGAFLDSKLSFNLGGSNYHPDFETFYWNPNTSPNLYHDFSSPVTGLTVSDVKSMILVGGITLTAEQA